MDNNPLTYIHKSLKVDTTSGWWLSFHYKPGSTNVDADMLLRLHENPELTAEHITAFIEDLAEPYLDYCDVGGLGVEVLATSSTSFDWVESQTQDPDLVEIRRLVRVQL